MMRFAGDDVRAARALIDAVLESGVTLFDTAAIYGGAFGDAETLLGRVFAESPALRDRIVLATKAGIVRSVPYDSATDYLEAALEASLRRLGTDRVDL